MTSENIPAYSGVVEIPIGNSYLLPVIYLMRNPIVDNAIHTNKWDMYPISRTFYGNSIDSAALTVHYGGMSGKKGHHEGSRGKALCGAYVSSSWPN